jgi:tRNA pseudouridine38-40 synthase
MNRYKLTFEYDGTDFNGWQKQPSGRTVEGEIEKGFSQLFQQDIDVIGQGRTDAGVHAMAQVAHVDLPPTFTCNKIVHAMKGLLPRDIALHSVSQVASSFHARFDAVGRKYQYRATLGKSPMRRRSTWEISQTPDFKLLQKLATIIIGSHDFINFCVPSGDSYQTTICSIAESSWDLSGNQLSYTIQGNRFLRHMVRRLVGSMMHTATGRETTDDFTRLLKGKESKTKAFSAPPCGLILKEVLYKE